MLKGVNTAIITPFKLEHGQAVIDYTSWANLIEWQISQGVDGLTLFGTTGESATLTPEEKILLTKSAVEVVKGRIPLIVGSGSNNTKASIELTQSLRNFGVDAALAISPYYNKPTQAGLIAHFSAIAKEGGLPVVVYNIPARTNVKINIETFSELTKVPGIIGVKQAVDSIVELTELAGVLAGSKIEILAGDDPLVYAVMTVGGKGVISASANVAPKKFKEIITFAQAGKWNEALKIQQDLLPLINALFAETNPGPVKAALEIMKKIPCSAMRLPLVDISATTREELKKVLPN